jgi:hypothetical protein
MLSLPSPQAYPLVHWLPMISAQADRIVWGGHSETRGALDSADEVLLRVTTLPSLAEINEEIKHIEAKHHPTERE